MHGYPLLHTPSMLSRLMWPTSFCRVHFRTRGGVFGFTLIEDWEYKIKDLRPEENTPEDLPEKVLDY